MMQWTASAVSDGLGAHAEAWDALNRRLFSSHPLLDSRFWNAALRHFGTAGVSLWRLDDDAEPQAMCLLVHHGWGRWQSFLPSQAQIVPTEPIPGGMAFGQPSASSQPPESRSSWLRPSQAQSLCP